MAVASLDESEPALPSEISVRLFRTAREAVIALFPVAASEEIPAALGWGSWNACPSPEQHAAILRYWRERYGAELQAKSHDTLELTVSNPPRDFDAAIELARDQYAYAFDVVEQGEHPTIGSLASALVGSDHWHFWWD